MGYLLWLKLRSYLSYISGVNLFKVPHCLAFCLASDWHAKVTTSLYWSSETKNLLFFTSSSLNAVAVNVMKLILNPHHQLDNIYLARGSEFITIIYETGWIMFCSLLHQFKVQRLCILTIYYCTPIGSDRLFIMMPWHSPGPTHRFPSDLWCYLTWHKRLILWMPSDVLHAPTSQLPLVSVAAKTR